ncbi:sensor histidine kinase [Methylibium sp.]|uniref:sensor histidine kinase n=1 Tax=Methylibium sp. TaxID=2067992 RepID=UPI003D0FB143
MTPTRQWRTSALSFPLALLVALALLLISETSYHRSLSALNETSVAFDARIQVGQVLRYMVDAETGQRGFLLSGKDSYLAPYDDAVRQIKALLPKLNTYYAGHPAQLPDFELLARAIEKKLSEMSETIQLYRAGRDSAWHGLMESDIGLEAQQTIRVVTDRLVGVEMQRLQAHQEQMAQTLLISRLGVAAMTVLSVLAFYFYLEQTRALVAERERQRAVLQAERDLLESEVARRTRELTVLARHLQTTQESERSHLARELHDELGALLTSAKLDVARLRSRLPTVTPEVSTRFAHLNEALNSGIALKRRIIEDLRPSALSHLGLTVSLDILAREFGERSGLAVHTAFSPVTLGDSGNLTVYRFVQEALTNVAKYARASRVEVCLSTDADCVEISVRDNGSGFDPAAVHSGAHGLTGMRFRVEAEGGRMTVVSQPGLGVLLSARLPVRPPGMQAAPGGSGTAPS